MYHLCQYYSTLFSFYYSFSVTFCLPDPRFFFSPILSTHLLVWKQAGKRKKINVSWKNVSRYFSSNQWKGGGIDGCFGPRTGDSDRIVLTHYTGPHVRTLVGGGRGWGRDNTRSRTSQRVVFAGRRVLSNSPIFYVICYILSSGGRYFILQDHRERLCPPSLDDLDRL